MIELRQGTSLPTLRSLFPTAGHTWRRCFAVLDGDSRGRILADDAERPGWAAVQEFSDDSTLFLAGALSRELVADLIERCSRDRVTCIGLSDDDPLLHLLPANADYDGHDIDFEDRDPDVDLTSLITLPDRLRLARIDADTAPRCAWIPWMMASGDAAVKHGIGFCLLDGERVVAEAFAGPIVGGALEMATITDTAYQRRGLGTIVCARTILECEQNGYTTWWNTGLTNLGSSALARKLGYRTERQYRLLAWYPAGASGDDATA